MLKIIKVFTASLIFIISSASAEVAKIKDVEKIKQAIVTISSRISVSAYEDTGNWYGTGFITDIEDGIIVTNAHVIGRGAVGTYFVTFHNGKQAEARPVYCDSYVDFAILKVEKSELPTEVQKIEFTDKLPKVGDDIFIVGNAEGQGFSLHSGYLSDLYDINGDMPQGSYVINMNTTGGASGSPILNDENKAIGVLYGSGQTYALGLKGSYPQYALKPLKLGKEPSRRHIGVMTELYSLDKAIKHREFPKIEAQQYLKKFPDARNRAVAVYTVLPGSTAESIILPGDIIWEIDGRAVSSDLTVLDDAMNMATKDQVELVIYRNGEKLKKAVKLYDINKNKVTKMLDFAGALFFEADDFVASKSGIPLGSVALANVQTGSSFSVIPEMYVQNYKNIYRLVIKTINGHQIQSLSDVIKAMDTAIEQKFISVSYKNYQPYFPKFGGDRGFISSHEDLVEDITFDSIDTSPRLLKFDEVTSRWVNEEIK
jgi:S1-C subfamily serine protease